MGVQDVERVGLDPDTLPFIGLTRPMPRQVSQAGHDVSPS
jgi:hypothetical protein